MMEEEQENIVQSEFDNIDIIPPLKNDEQQANGEACYFTFLIKSFER